MQIEVTSKIKFAGDTGSVLILDVALLPKGSGNRAAAERLAHDFRTNPELAPHVEKITAGTSRVIVQLRNSPSLLAAIVKIKQAARDLHGQLHMFGRPA